MAVTGSSRRQARRRSLSPPARSKRFSDERASSRTGGERPDRLAGRLYNAAIVLGTPLETPDDFARETAGEKASARARTRRHDRGKIKSPTSFIEISPCATQRFIAYIPKLPASSEVNLINPTPRGEKIGSIFGDGSGPPNGADLFIAGRESQPR